MLPLINNALTSVVDASIVNYGNLIYKEVELSIN